MVIEVQNVTTLELLINRLFITDLAVHLWLLLTNIVLILF